MMDIEKLQKIILALRKVPILLRKWGWIIFNKKKREMYMDLDPYGFLSMLIGLTRAIKQTIPFSATLNTVKILRLLQGLLKEEYWYYRIPIFNIILIYAEALVRYIWLLLYLYFAFFKSYMGGLSQENWPLFEKLVSIIALLRAIVFGSVFTYICKIIFESWFYITLIRNPIAAMLEFIWEAMKLLWDDIKYLFF